MQARVRARGWAALMATGLLLTLGAGAASARSVSYCADQNAVFKDRHANVGISDQYIQNGAFAPQGNGIQARIQFRNCSYGWMAADHIGIVRVGFSWAVVEATQGRYDFSYYDELASELARHHMTMMPDLLQAPQWASQIVANPTCAGMWPPSSPYQFAAFAALVVRRYGRGGSFWRANPSLPYYPVRAWQVWNEPNLCIFWAPAISPRGYATLLRATYRAIKKVDRGATVVMAGEPYATRYSSASSFYTALYRAGARGSFDALALHDYAPSVKQAVLRLQVVRGIMNKFRDRKTPIWVTEMGWASGGPPNEYRAGVSGQRNDINQFFAVALRYRKKLRLGTVFWFGWRDVSPQAVGTADFWGYHTSLLTFGLQPKPALAAFVAAARRYDR